MGLDKISLCVQNLSCFYKCCSNGKDGPCDNEAYITPFTFIHLEPCNARDAQAYVESIPELEMDWEALVTTLEVGHHFAIIVKEGNNEGSNFGLSFVKNHYMLWKRKGKLIVGGKWCFKENRLSLEDISNNKERAMSYVLCNGGPTIIYAHLIFVTKFTMQVATYHQRRGRCGRTHVINTFYHFAFTMLFVVLGI